MKNRLLLALCCVFFWSEEIHAEVDNEVKRGTFPFMAVVYYPDETVVDSTGARFQRVAILIRSKWLISSAIDHSVLDNVPLGFPRKTLLAKAGAVSLDANYTLNEDEDEQEREIIQVVRPSIHTQETWWLSDITLLQTLLPFKITSAVAVTNIKPKREYADKNCIILVFAKKYGNATEEKILMQLGVELLPPTTEHCGIQFSETSMTCAIDSDETKNVLYDPEFCQGNSGGPLMCEGEVMGLQTYIENNCKQPHLYQLLTSWESFINCGVEERCNKDENCNICTVINKDIPASGMDTVTLATITQLISDTPSLTGGDTVADEIYTKSSFPSTISSSDLIQTSLLDSFESVEPEGSEDGKSATTTTSSVEPTTTTEQYETTVAETEKEPATETETTKETTSTTAPTTTSTTTTTASPETPSTRAWPIERHSDESRRLEQSEEVPRTTKVEAQMQQMREDGRRTQVARSASDIGWSGINLFSLIMLLIPLTLAHLL